jgi:hypothetical protein
MVNDLLNGHQRIVCVRHCMVLWVACLTIDKFQVSIVNDLTALSLLSVALRALASTPNGPDLSMAGLETVLVAKLVWC